MPLIYEPEEPVENTSSLLGIGFLTYYTGMVISADLPPTARCGAALHSFQLFPREEMHHRGKEVMLWPFGGRLTACYLAGWNTNSLNKGSHPPSLSWSWNKGGGVSKWCVKSGLNNKHIRSPLLVLVVFSACHVSTKNRDISLFLALSVISYLVQGFGLT